MARISVEEVTISRRHKDYPGPRRPRCHPCGEVTRGTEPISRNRF